jgi:outer membrane protein OmpA-like peptidoglycan-associated protein
MLKFNYTNNFFRILMRILFTALIFISFTVNYFSQNTDKIYYHAFSGTTVMTFEGGTTLGMTTYKEIHPEYLGSASLEYFFPTFTKSSFGIRLFGGTGFIAGKDATKTPELFRTTITFGGAGFTYILQAGQKVFPYFFAGGSYLWFDPRSGEDNSRLPNNASGAYSRQEFNFNSEIGTRFLLTENLSFNLNGGVQISPHNYLDDNIAGPKNDLFFHISAGFSFAFFSDRDSDGDGIPDSKDKCSNTPSGVKIDEFGCPIDSDGDGVPDFLDKCPNTPKNVTVNKDGCPLDTDGDGVPDYLDICPNTPPGVKVDDLGCPFDLDGDGVPDYLDKCPNTPHNVEVDENGCPKDSDHDGVPDYLDKCPNTPFGTKVDSNGCPVITETPKPVEIPKVAEPPIKELVLSAGTNFAIGKADLLPAAFPDLNKLIRIMRENPVSRWSIEGYTDNTGSQKKNKQISLERAKSVLNYFVSKGIPRNRFEIKGMGRANPVASNKTEAGRSKNRRVVIKNIY